MPDTAVAEFKPLSRPAMAARLASDIPEGWYVNLGIGIPTMVADHVPVEREVDRSRPRTRSIRGSSPPASNTSRCARAALTCTTPTASP